MIMLFEQNATLQLLATMPELCEALHGVGLHSNTQDVEADSQGDDQNNEPAAPEQAQAPHEPAAPAVDDMLLKQLRGTLMLLQREEKTTIDPLAFVKACDPRLILTYPILEQNDANEFLGRLVEHCDDVLKQLKHPQYFDEAMGGRIVYIMEGRHGEKLIKTSTARQELPQTSRRAGAPVLRSRMPHRARLCPLFGA